MKRISVKDKSFTFYLNSFASRLAKCTGISVGFNFSVIEYLTVLQFLYIILAFFSLNGREDFGIEVCVADYLMLGARPWFLGVIIVPFVVMFNNSLFRDDMIVTRVVKFKSSKDIFKRQCIKIFFIDIFIVIYQICSLCTWAFLVVKETINWDKIYSYYFVQTKKVINISFGDFIVRYAIGLLGALYIFSIIGHIFYLLSKRIAGIALIIAITIIDYSPLCKYKLIFGNVISYYGKIGDIGKVLMGWLIGVIITIILLIIGNYVADRKEYLDAV